MLQNHLNFIASEVHTAIGGLFNPTLTPDAREATKARAHEKIAYLESHLLKDGKNIFGDDVTIADLYLYIVLSWGPYVGVAVTEDKYPHVAAFSKRIAAHPDVAAAHAEMATLPAA